MSKRIGVTERRELLHRFENWCHAHERKIDQEIEQEWNRHLRGLKQYKDRLKKAEQLAEVLETTLNAAHEAKIHLKIDMVDGYSHYTVGDFPYRVSWKPELVIRQMDAEKEAWMASRKNAFHSYYPELEAFRNMLWATDDRATLLALLPMEFLPETETNDD